MPTYRPNRFLRDARFEHSRDRRMAKIVTTNVDVGRGADFYVSPFPTQRMPQRIIVIPGNLNGSKKWAGSVAPNSRALAISCSTAHLALSFRGTCRILYLFFVPAMI